VLGLPTHKQDVKTIQETHCCSGKQQHHPAWCATAETGAQQGCTLDNRLDTQWTNPRLMPVCKQTLCQQTLAANRILPTVMPSTQPLSAAGRTRYYSPHGRIQGSGTTVSLRIVNHKLSMPGSADSQPT
jgi:hypothetical protein